MTALAERSYRVGAREFPHRALLELEMLDGGREVGWIIGAGTRFTSRDEPYEAVVLWVGYALATRTFQMDRLRSAREVTPEELVSRLAVGSRVRISCYGNSYVGTVEKLGRTRATVRYRTRGDERSGASRVRTENAALLGPVG